MTAPCPRPYNIAMRERENHERRLAPEIAWGRFSATYCRRLAEAGVLTDKERDMIAFASTDAHSRIRHERRLAERGLLRDRDGKVLRNP